MVDSASCVIHSGHGVSLYDAFCEPGQLSLLSLLSRSVLVVYRDVVVSYATISSDSSLLSSGKDSGGESH